MNNNIQWGKEVYPYIISVLDSMNISRDYAPYVFAMAANESGWGQNPSGKYNYFGMKATKNQKGTVRTTHEGFGSNRVKINDKFLDFESLQDGIKRGIERLNNRFGAFNVPVKQFTWNLHQNGYYTDTPAHYEDTINGIINGRSFKNVLNGLSIPERQNINQTNWNSVPRWQPPVQFKKGGNLISKFRQGGASRHYYTTNSNILPELVVYPQRYNSNFYVVDEFGNPARTVDALKEARQYGGHAGIIRDAMSGRELRNNQKFQGRDEYLAQQKQADQQVYQIIPSTGQMFDIVTVGGLNNLSPTQWMRRVYDTRKLIQGKMSGNDYINHWFFGNNGIASDEYARKHPYRTMAANLIGDIATFGAASTLRKMPSWYRTMQAENQAVQNTVADNWRNVGKGATSYDTRDNIVLYRANASTPKTNSKGESYGDNTGQYVGKWFTDDSQKPLRYASNYAKRGENPIYYRTKPIPRYWAEQQRVSNKISNPNIEYEPEDFILEDGVLGAEAGILTGRPGMLSYLQQKPIFNNIEPTTYYIHPEQFIHPAEAVRPGRQYVRPSVQKGMVSEPLMDSKSDLRAAITPEDLANRKFFSVEEYGPEPVYTRETVPQKIKVKKGDITESHMNDGTPGSEVTDANKVANEWFNKADHGQSVSYETDHSLSTDSYPIALLKMNRWQQQGLGQFIQSESAPKWMRLNRLGNKSFKELQEAIARVNKLTGQNYKIEQRLSPIIGSNGYPTLHPITGQPLMAKGIYVQPIGFFKYKNGNKIRTKLIKH